MPTEAIVRNEEPAAGDYGRQKEQRHNQNKPDWRKQNGKDPAVLDENAYDKDQHEGNQHADQSTEKFRQGQRQPPAIAQRAFGVLRDAVRRAFKPTESFFLQPDKRRHGKQEYRGDENAEQYKAVTGQR